MTEVKYTLRKLDNSYLITSNEEIREGDYYYEPTSDEPFSIAYFNLAQSNYRSKVIAKTNFYHNSDLPNIDFSALTKSECNTIKYINVEVLADRSSEIQEATYTSNHKVTYVHGYIDGFRKAQKLLGFSKEDLADYLAFVDNNYYQTDAWIDRDSGVGVPRHVILNNYLNSLNKVKEWGVKIELENCEHCKGSSVFVDGNNNCTECPACISGKSFDIKITNNIIKVIKIL
jgi:hypothetical protein